MIIEADERSEVLSSRRHRSDILSSCNKDIYFHGGFSKNVIIIVYLKEQKKKRKQSSMLLK